MTALDIISRTDFFRGVSEKNRVLAAAICIPKKLKKREDLFHEGEKGFAVHLCGEGSIQVYKTGRDGKDSVIKIIEPGEIFGEVVLFENSVYPASATALVASLVYVMPRQDFHDLLENAAFRNDFIGMLMRKQRYLAEQIFALTNQSLAERLLRFLSKSPSPGSRPLSKKDIAAAIGVTPESLSRTLTVLKRKGIIEEKGREIWLISV
ncbi:MAG: Crp/Fnr family transcriptional regulator [Fibrobacterota bacterium]